MKFHNFADLWIKLCDAWVMISKVSFLDDNVNSENDDMGVRVFKILNISIPH